MVQGFEPIEAVAGVAHYLAGLGHLPKLPCKLQDSDFRLDDFLRVCHSVLLVSKVYLFFRQVSDFILAITINTKIQIGS